MRRRYRAAIPADVARYCACCGQLSRTCMKVASTNGKRIYWKCDSCRRKTGSKA